MPPTSSRTSGSIWAIWLGWYWRCHGYWTSIAFKATVQRKGKGTRVTKVTGLSISYYTLWPREGHQGVHPFFGTMVCQQISRQGSPRGIEPKRWLSWQIYSGRSWSSSFYSIIQYGPAYGPFTFLLCHGVSSEVGRFFLPTSLHL